MQSQKTKKVPLRKCVSCNERKEKKELIRIVAAGGNPVLDKTSKMNGRGAYVCRDEKCVLLAKKKKALDRALEIKVPEDFYELVIKELQS
ncbi:MAG: YlxR family protein [Monoglobales bacterium]